MTTTRRRFHADDETFSSVLTASTDFVLSLMQIIKVSAGSTTENIKSSTLPGVSQLLFIRLSALC